MAKRVEPARPSPATAPPDVPNHPDSAAPALQSVVGKETIIEQARYPAVAGGPELIPEPRSLAAAPAEAKLELPAEQVTTAASHSDTKIEPAQEPPLLQALRCFLDKRPAEAVAWLGRYDKPSQELLLCLLPLSVRLTEGRLERYDSREASAVLEQLDYVSDRVTPFLRRRAELTIKKMCFCSVDSIEGYGKYKPKPDGYGFQPGESAEIYVELQNLSDQRMGNAYSIHLTSTIYIREFNGRLGWQHTFDDDGPEISQSERHDFYTRYLFVVPKWLRPGFYTLYLKIIDEPTGREVGHTLDFRVISASGRGRG